MNYYGKSLKTSNSVCTVSYKRAAVLTICKGEKISENELRFNQSIKFA